MPQYPAQPGAAHAPEQAAYSSIQPAAVHAPEQAAYSSIQPAAVYQPLVTPAAPTTPQPARYPHQPAATQPVAQQQPIAQQPAAVQPIALQHPVASHNAATPIAPQPTPQRPGFDAIFGGTDVAPHETLEAPALRRRAAVEATPHLEAEQVDRPVGRSSASSVSGSRSSGRSSRREEPAGFDALFSGLDNDPVDPDEEGGNDRRGGRGGRADRKAAKAAKAARISKPEKPEKPEKGAKRSASSKAPGPRRGAAVPAAPELVDGDLAFLVNGTGAAASAASALAADAGSAATTSGLAGLAASGLHGGPGAAAPHGATAAPARSAVEGRAASAVVPPVDPTAGFAVAVAAAAGALPAAGPSAAPAPAPLNLELQLRRGSRPEGSPAAAELPADVAEVSDLLGFGSIPEPLRHHPSLDAAPASDRTSDRSAESRRDFPRNDTPAPAARPARSWSPQPATRPGTRPGASVPARRRGAAGRVVSVVAMSFAALLAIATTIPSLSLLSPADVQALALANYGGDTLDGQRVVVNGDIVAQSMQREGYESQTIEEYARAAGIRPEATFTNNPAGTIQWPFAVGVHIGDRFGYRDCYGCSSNHGGQDFNPGLGAEIQAIADGTVAVSTDEGGSLGVVMMIDHMIDGELITSVYAHMEYDSRRFEVGDTVHVADVIGTTGDTGMSTGPHLHFEIRVGGVDGTKIDPLEWLYANTN
ncbi:M23 family metallopeptidase [Agromyces sp. Soil535]|uniref:M23 family metallopeptidase n=1 Tax=Agromyces sp. Soil535 TaxID=1736390 RepID=UPI0006F4517A|nr:M23 family metallopeptidase [Agromyces sp. Soil535]KRE30011.1 hypothetical protein ASG80_18985 [Agromyces sp. Soil535]